METTDLPATQTTKPRPFIRWLKLLGWSVLILAILVAIRLIWDRNKAANQLQEVIAELDRTDPGWRIEDIEAAREEIPEEKNSAPVVLAAVQRLAASWPSKGFSEGPFHILSPDEQMPAADFAVLSRELAVARPALETAIELADRPRGRYRLVYPRHPYEIVLPHDRDIRRLVSLLVLEAMRLNQEGESKRALTVCRAAVNAARSPGDEPFYGSQWLRISSFPRICQAIERTLAQGEPLLVDMRVLQTLLEEEAAFPGFLIAARGERAIFHSVFEAVEHGEHPVNRFTDSRSGWLQKTRTLLSRMDTRQDHALLLTMMTRHIDELQQPLHEQTALEQRFKKEIRDVPEQALISKTLLPSVSNIGAAFHHNHASLRCTIVALAAECYRREQKRWPDSLDELCPRYLLTVPLDPYDGASLRFRRIEDGVIIYSVGQDTVDNGGHLDRNRPASSGADIGCRLWNVVKRRQPPRPKPVHEEKPR